MSTRTQSAKPLDQQNATQTYQALHLINGEHFSGAERVQDLLGMALPKYGVQPHFAALKLKQFETHRQSTCSLFNLAMSSKFDLGVVKRATQLCLDIKPDVIHAHTPRSALVGSRVASRLDLPFVYHIHSPTSRDSTRKIGNWINQRVENRAMAQAAALVPVSMSLRLHLKKLGIQDERIFVVPNGVDSLPWVERESPSETWTLGTVALFRERKGTEVLLESIALLKQKGITVRLLAVGGFETTDYESFLKQRTNELGIESQVEWTGFCQNVDSQFQEMDAMVLPSLFGEGLPMVVLEAMTNGVPVIATGVEGVPEAIRDGQDGLLALPGDATDLAHKIERLVSGEVSWAELRRSAFDRQAEQFSTDSMAAGVARVYQHLLNRKQVEAELPRRERH